jgi:hypothetical protein
MPKQDGDHAKYSRFELRYAGIVAVLSFISAIAGYTNNPSWAVIIGTVAVLLQFRAEVYRSRKR